MSVLGATDDTYPLPADLDGWERVTAGPCRTTFFDGGHFFPATRRGDVLALLTGLLVDLVAGVPTTAVPGPRPEAS